MKKFLVILRDELGDEFSVETQAISTDDAWDTIAMDYPESEVIEAMPIRFYKKGDE